MYGLVNRAVKGLVVREFGEEAWQRIRSRAGLEVDHFGRMQTYDDAITYGLVTAASEELGAPVDDLLEAFGRYWVLYVAEEGYGSMLSLAGDSLAPFLEQLDAMHARVATSHVEMRPPSFVLQRRGDHMLLHYHSTRAGLGAMVVGLLHGLAARFDEPITVEWRRAGDGADHDRYVIRAAS